MKAYLVQIKTEAGVETVGLYRDLEEAKEQAAWESQVGTNKLARVVEVEAEWQE